VQLIGIDRVVPRKIVRPRDQLHSSCIGEHFERVRQREIFVQGQRVVRDADIDLSKRILQGVQDRRAERMKIARDDSICQFLIDFGDERMARVDGRDDLNRNARVKLLAAPRDDLDRVTVIGE